MGKRYRWPPAGDSRPGDRPGWDMGGTAPSVSVLVLAGGRAAARHDSAAFEDASMALLEWADAVGREAVGAACCEVVATVLAELWEQGWQPGELVRACRRGRSARHISLLVSALAAPRTGPVLAARPPSRCGRRNSKTWAWRPDGRIKTGWPHGPPAPSWVGRRP